MTHAQAAGELHWSERTLRRRLAEARERLRARLGRRGLAHDDAMLGAVFLREAQAPVPPAWQEATVRAALDILDHAVAAGAVSPAARSLTREVLKTMFVQKLTIAAAALMRGRPDGLGGRRPPSSRGATSHRSRRRPPSPSGPLLGPEAEADPLDAVGTFRCAAACSTPTASRSPAPRSTSVTTLRLMSCRRPDAHGPAGRVAASDADGRFHFELDKSASDFPYRD